MRRSSCGSVRRWTTRSARAAALLVATGCLVTACAQAATDTGSAGPTSAQVTVPAAENSGLTTGSAITTASPSTEDAASSAAAPAPAEPAVQAVDPQQYSMPGYGYAWVSPAKKVYCRIDATSEYSSGCQGGDVPVPAGAESSCTTPSFRLDQLSKGFYLMPDRVVPTCFNQATFGSQDSKVLDYDHSITMSGYTCTSRRTGMECTTGNGHGFEMSTDRAVSH